MKTIKKILRTRVKRILSLSATIILAFVCYAAFAQGRRGDSERGNNDAGVGISPVSQIPDSLPESLENESSSDFVKRRQEWMDRFFGLTPGVSTTAYAKALIEARAMPVAPLTQNWSFQALSPMWNDWGGLGGNCTIQYPDPQHTFCGSSARIDAIAVDPLAANGDVVYVGTEGGLSKSTNGGLNWSYLSDSLPSQSIRSIAVDPVASNIVYAGTGTNQRFGVGLYRSTNSGSTWTIDLGVSQFSGKTVGKIAIDPATAGSPTTTTLYVSVTQSGTHSIWKSTNSGTTWSPIPIRGPTPNAGTFYDIVIERHAGITTIYAAAPDGLFKSTNGGASWSTSIHPRGTPPCPSAPACLAFVNSTLYIAFRECPGGSPCSSLCTTRTTISKSTNGGSSWTDLSQPCAPNPPNPDLCADLYTFGVNPADSNQIFVGGGGILVYSVNGGTNWEWAHEVHVDNHSIAFCPTNPQRNYLGTDGGIYRADHGDPICTDHPICWYSKNQNLAGSLIYGLSISRDDSIAMGNQDNGTQLYAAPTPNPPWRRTSPGTGDGFKPKIDQNNSNKFYFTKYGCVVSSDWGAPYRTIDGGATSLAVTPPGAFGECSSFFPAMFVSSADSARVIMGFRNVWRSTDSGTSWTRIGGRSCPNPGPTPPDCFAPNGPCHANCGIEPSPTPGTATVVSEAPSNTNVIYAVFDTSRLWVTENANAGIPPGTDATWTNRTNGLPSGIQAVTVNPLNQQVAYAACNSANSGLYRTMNTGASWTPLGFAGIGCWDVAIDPATPSHVFAATGSGVYMSTDAGTTWGLTLGIPAGMAVTSLSFNAATRQLAASTYGRGVYKLDLDDVPPTVSITSPLPNAIVSGSINITATASDNHKVVGVQFKVDDFNIGAEVASPPYVIGWNTTLWTNGQHKLTAVARDPAGNVTTSVTVKVTVSNP